MAALAGTVALAACGGGSAEPAAGESVPTAAPPPAPVLPAEVTARAPNEAGLVPVLMYHKIVPVPDGNPYSRTIEEFEADLDRLWREGYVPIRLGDLVAGRIAVEKGRSPIVLTFDDSSADHFRYLPDGSLDPDSAVGIMNAFAEEHPDFGRAAVFYVNGNLFDQPGTEAKKLQELVAWGYEIGNHTFNHVNLGEISAKAARRDIAMLTAAVAEHLPDYRIRLFCLPFGVLPGDPAVIERGQWQGTKYRHVANVLVGADPSPSPFAKRFDPMNIPRIRAAGTAEDELQIDHWLDRLAADGSAFVSDGDPQTVTVSASVVSKIEVREGQRVVETA